MKAGLNALTLHILTPAEAVLVLLLCPTKIVLLHDMGATDLEKELLSTFRTCVTSPENLLQNNVLESKVADGRGAGACQQCPSEAGQTLKCIWHLSPVCTLSHLVPKSFTVLHTSKVNGVWMQSGTEQGDLNTLVKKVSTLVQKVFCCFQAVQCEKGKWASMMHPRLCLKLVTRWEAVAKNPLLG